MSTATTDPSPIYRLYKDTKPLPGPGNDTETLAVPSVGASFPGDALRGNVTP